MSKKLELLKKKLLYRASYRGTKEMDILLSTFVKKHLDLLDFDQLKEMELFLEFEDEIIYNYYNFNKTSTNIEKNQVSQFFKKFKI